MKPDLIERLRDERHIMQGDGFGALLETTSEASKEIERLRALLDERDLFMVRQGLWDACVGSLPLQPILPSGGGVE